MLTKLITTVFKMFCLTYRFLSQLGVKISNVEIDTFWVSGRFMETEISIVYLAIVHCKSKLQDVYQQMHFSH